MCMHQCYQLWLKCAMYNAQDEGEQSPCHTYISEGKRKLRYHVAHFTEAGQHRLFKILLAALRMHEQNMSAPAFSGGHCHRQLAMQDYLKLWFSAGTIGSDLVSCLQHHFTQVTWACTWHCQWQCQIGRHANIQLGLGWTHQFQALSSRKSESSEPLHL